MPMAALLIETVNDLPSMVALESSERELYSKVSFTTLPCRAVLRAELHAGAGSDLLIIFIIPAHKPNSDERQFGGEGEPEANGNKSPRQRGRKNTGRGKRASASAAPVSAKKKNLSPVKRW